jgi:hypothetical protein
VSKKSDGSRAAAKANKKKEKTPEEEEAEAIDAFMTEIEADLRDEQLIKLWTKYKTSIYGAMVALVLGVAVYQFWQGRVEARLTAQANGYAQAIAAIEQDNPDAALETLGEVAAGGGNYRAVADLQRAALLVDKGQIEDALSLYKSLRSDSSLAPPYRDLASLLWAMHGTGREDTTVLEDAIYPLTDPSNAFSFSALELLALLAIERGDIDETRSILEELIADANTPVSIRGRAQEMLSVYGAKTAGREPDVQTDDAAPEVP